MATVDELLGLTDVINDVLTIDNNLRTINIPSSVTNIGVESDDDVRRLYFSMPRYCSEFDLSEFEIRINYRNAHSEGDSYKVTDAAVDENTIAFSWLVGRFAVAYAGNVKFNICLRKITGTGEDAVVEKEFNTTIATLPVLTGLETTEQVVSAYPDLVQTWQEELFGRFSGRVDPTLSVSGQAADAAVVGNKFDIAEARINNITSLPEGSTTGDAELTDIRVAYDGTTYSTAGEAVREQVGELKSDLVNLQEITNNLCDEKFVSGYYINFTNGVVGVNADGWGYYGAYIPINVGQSITFSSPNIANIELNIIIVYYDENKEYAGSFGGRTISETSRQFSVTFSQESAKYFRFNLRNVDDFVNNGFNLMVEYGSSASAYIPHIVAKNTEKIQELEDKFENEVTELKSDVDDVKSKFENLKECTISSAYMEFNRGEVETFIPYKSSNNAGIVYVTNGNFIAEYLTYYNNNGSAYTGSNGTNDTNRVRTSSFAIPVGIGCLTFSGIDTEIAELLAVRAYNQDNELLNSGAILIPKDGYWNIKTSANVVSIHLLFGSTTGEVIHPSEISAMPLMLNTGTEPKEYIAGKIKTVPVSRYFFDNETPVSPSYALYNSNLIFARDADIRFVYKKMCKIKDAIKLENQNTYFHDKFAKDIDLPNTYFFEYYNPEYIVTSEKFSCNTTADEYMTEIHNLYLANSNYITRRHTNKKDASGTYSLYYYEMNEKSFANASKPTILIICNQHGYEKNSAFAGYWLMDALCNHHSENEMINFLRNEVRIIIAPLINPWGFNAYVGDNIGTEIGYTNFDGVNINRDYENLTSPEANFVMDVSDRAHNAIIAIDVHGNGTTRTSDSYEQTNWHSYRSKSDLTLLNVSKHFHDMISPKLCQELGVANNHFGLITANNDLSTSGTVTNAWTQKCLSNLCFELPQRLPTETEEISKICQKVGAELLINFIGSVIKHYCLLN